MHFFWLCCTLSYADWAPKEAVRYFLVWEDASFHCICQPLRQPQRYIALFRSRLLWCWLYMWLVTSWHTFSVSVDLVQIKVLPNGRFCFHFHWTSMTCFVFITIWNNNSCIKDKYKWGIMHVPHTVCHIIPLSYSCPVEFCNVYFKTRNTIHSSLVLCHFGQVLIRLVLFLYRSISFSLLEILALQHASDNHFILYRK